MPRAGNGTYNLVTNSWFPPVSGVLATPTDWQTFIEDVAAALTQSVSADGQTPITGNINMNGNKLTALAAGTATGDSLRFQQLFDQGVEVDVASAATTDIGVQNTNFIRVTGTTTITSFGTNYRGPRFVRFGGILTLTHNATTLILPTGANITTAAGDRAIIAPIGNPASGWQVLAYQKADGTALVAAQQTLDTTRIDVASASTVNLTSSAPNTRHINITGTTTITAFTIAVGLTYFVRFDNSLTLTNSASIVTQTGANIETRAGDTCIIRSTAANTVEVLSYVTFAPENQIAPISASVGSNALTLTINPCELDFRSTTLGSGTVNRRKITTPISLVVSSGSTLGTTNATLSKLAVLAIDNAGTVEVAVVNLSGGVNINEEGVISTTAEGGAGAADSASTIYSTTARTNVAYRIVGFVESTQATAGTWATAPSLVHASNPLAKWMGGYGQSWQDVSGSRALATTYTNSTGRDIVVQYQVSATAGVQASITINGQAVAIGGGLNAAGNSCACIATIPAGATYNASNTNITLTNWREKR